MKTIVLFISLFYLSALHSQLSLTENKSNLVDFNISILNYTNLNKVVLFEKVEIGISLPTDLNQKINNFVTNKVVPQNQRMNPYLEWEIRVYTKFTHYPSCEEIVVDGFFMQEFAEFMNPIPAPDANGMSDAEYNNLGGYNLIPTEFSFRTRFSPSKVGFWEAQVFIETPESKLESDLIHFEVVESNNMGFVHTSANGRYLELGNKTFIPVGCNAPWPRTDQVFDREFADATKYFNGNLNQTQFIDESYRSRSKMVPRVYDIYKNVLQQLIDGGANSFRTIMVPFATDIEYGKLGNYTDRLTQAQELDEILEFAEEKNVYLQWSLDVQFKYMLNGPGNYYISCSWNSGGFDGDRNCYSTIKGVKSPVDFFSNLDAKKYYKQRLRYIIARWGYSTQISIFELLSEENQVGNNFNDGADHTEGLQESYLKNVKVYEAWNREMAAYIKSQYNGKLHLLTCSYAGLPAKNDFTYQDPNLDVIGFNAYDDGRISFGSHPVELFSKFILNLNADLFKSNAPNGGEGKKKTFETLLFPPKPIVLSETGFSTSFPRYKSNCENSLVEYKRQMWQMPFSGAAATYNWDVWYFPEMYGEFKNLKLYLDQFNFGGTNELWVPGSSSSTQNKNGTVNYTFNQEAYDCMEDEERFKADMVYMVSKDRTKAAGVITNKTYNWYTSSQNSDCGNYPYNEVINKDEIKNTEPLYSFWDEDFDDKNQVLNKYIKPYSIYPKNTQQEDFKSYKHSLATDVETTDLLIGRGSKGLALWNMNKADYFFVFKDFNEKLSTSESQTFSSSGPNKKVNIEVLIPGNEKEFIRTFYAFQAGKFIEFENTQEAFSLNQETKLRDAQIAALVTCEENGKGKYFLSAENTILELNIQTSTGLVIQKSAPNLKSLELNVSNFAVGVYILELLFQDGKKTHINIYKT